MESKVSGVVVVKIEMMGSKGMKGIYTRYQNRIDSDNDR